MSYRVFSERNLLIVLLEIGDGLLQHLLVRLDLRDKVDARVLNSGVKFEQ